MKINIYTFIVLSLVLVLMACSNKFINFTEGNLDVVNRDISSIDEKTNAVRLSNKEGDGLAIIKDVNFKTGTVELELQGENNPGRSFVGLAFNIQNDSTYEAVYFRPFNFQSKEKIRREHSMQYISHPKHSWRMLRTNFEGQFEAEYKRQPSPDDWFDVEINIQDDMVYVYDKKTNAQMLSVKRLVKPKSDKIGLWTGYNSKGAFRNLKIKKE